MVTKKKTKPKPQPELDGPHLGPNEHQLMADLRAVFSPREVANIPCSNCTNGIADGCYCHNCKGLGRVRA